MVGVGAVSLTCMTDINIDSLSLLYRLANKQDLTNAMSPLEIHTRLFQALPTGMNSLLVRVYPLSAIAPKSEFTEQVVPAFTWFDDALRNHKMAILNNVPGSSPSQPDATVTPPPPPSNTHKPDFDPRSPEILSEKLELWVARASTDSSPDEFLEQFNTFSLPTWDHYTHIRLAYIILTTFGRQKGSPISLHSIFHILIFFRQKYDIRRYSELYRQLYSNNWSCVPHHDDLLLDPDRALWHRVFARCFIPTIRL